MELREFISKTLEDIIGAVQDAQQKVPNDCVVPRVNKSFKSVGHGISEVQPVEFEVTVRADERAGSEARLSVVAAVIGGGVKGESGKSGGHAATLRFKIPVRLPRGEEEKKADS